MEVIDGGVNGDCNMPQRFGFASMNLAMQVIQSCMICKRSVSYGAIPLCLIVTYI